MSVSAEPSATACSWRRASRSTPSMSKPKEPSAVDGAGRVDGPLRLHSKITDRDEESGLERTRPDDRGAVHQAPLRQGVIADRQVHGTRVVPHQQVADPPVVAVKK